MDLILWRHADAEDAGAGGDPARRLTKKGRKQAERMARWIGARLEGEWRVICSPALRARETVEPLGRRFEVCESVSTSADAHGVLREAGWPEGGRVIVVGHQPTLGECAAILLGGAAGEVAVKKGSILWFATRSRDGREETVLKAVLDPDLLPD